MEVHQVIVVISLLLSLIPQLSESATVMVDGVSEWKDPAVEIGDSVIFEHKNHYGLYIFQNRRAFDLCNFTQATLLTKPNSTSYTWHTSRTGFFFFSFNNGSNKACKEGQKLAIKVSLSPPSSPASSPEGPPPTAPPESSGGIVSSSPAYPWPFHPRGSISPSPAPTPILPATSPMIPEKDGGMPFINSNPAVPLPTGEVDSATIRPIPTSGHGVQVENLTVPKALCYMVFMLLL